MIRTTHDDPVRILTLVHPPRNAIDLEVVMALGDAIEEAGRADGCRALVVTGDPPAFSAGIDVKAVPTYDAATRRKMIRGINRAIFALYGMPKPTVAAINGHALGGGLVAALACDVRLAAAGTYLLGLAEVAAGIPFPAVPMLVVQSELDPHTATTLTLTGCSFGPSDPLAARFLDAVVPAETLVQVAVERARALLELRAYAAVKRQLRASALARMEQVVREDADPLLREWF